MEITVNFQFKLSDVEFGGRTAFPSLEISIAPEKNSAIFWYNLDHHGEVTGSSLHGACPVVIGNKWGNEPINFRKVPSLKFFFFSGNFLDSAKRTNFEAQMPHKSRRIMEILPN